MNPIRRSCQSALRSSSNLSLLGNGSRRAFSRTSAFRRGALPSFLEPSSPELSVLLQDLNSKVLLPQHLTRDQQKLVFKKDNRAKLEAEPIEITLGDVTLPLQHLDRNKDIPARWKQLREIIAQSETDQDWENVLRMVEGFENAGIHLKDAWREMVVRKLNHAGRQHLVLKALQRASTSGLRLRKEGLVWTVLSGVHDKAALSDWNLEETRKALSLAEQIVELMDDKEHLGKFATKADLRSNPAVIALPLELSSALIKAGAPRAPLEKKVKKYASRLMAALEQNDLAEVLRIQELSAIAQKTHYKTANAQASALTTIANSMARAVPLWNGLKTARAVLGGDMPNASLAQSVENQTYEALTTGTQALDRLRTRDGKEIASEDGYVGFLQEALDQCELLHSASQKA